MKIKYFFYSILIMLVSCTAPTSNKSSDVDFEKNKIIEVGELYGENNLLTKFSLPDSILEKFQKPDSIKDKTSGYTGYEKDTEWFTASSNYNLDRIEGRTVTGDFNGDGNADVAAFYYYGGGVTKLHVFLSRYPNYNSWNQAGFLYQGNNGWWSATQYNADNIKGRVVSGDFDNDGDDDIAAIYNYGANDDAIHVWLSTGSSFSYQGNSGWRTLHQYDVTKITDRIVSGDFDNDGDDDIAAIYDYGANDDAIHVFLSTGSSFSYQGNSGWRTLHQYDVTKITDRIVSGDFDNDGDDDIAAIYDYGSGSDKVHVFLSTGSSFSYQGNSGWFALPYDTKDWAEQIVAGDFNNDGKYDIAYTKKPNGYPTDNEITWAPMNQWPDYEVDFYTRYSTGSDFSGGGTFSQIGSYYGTIPYSYTLLLSEYFTPEKHILLSGDFDGDGDDEIITFSETLTFLALDDFIPRDYTYILKTVDLKVNAH